MLRKRAEADRTALKLKEAASRLRAALAAKLRSWFDQHARAAATGRWRTFG